jgi:DNA invertase Pin-like site-specific DNA recombinase
MYGGQGYILGSINMAKRRIYKDPLLTYVHQANSKTIIKQSIAKFGSIRQLALRLDCSVAQVYRWANNESRMKILWYNNIQKLLEQ